MASPGNSGTGSAGDTGGGIRTFGVEEELLLVDPATGEAAPRIGPVSPTLGAT